MRLCAFIACEFIDQPKDPDKKEGFPTLHNVGFGRLRMASLKDRLRFWLWACFLQENSRAGPWKPRIEVMTPMGPLPPENYDFTFTDLKGWHILDEVVIEPGQWRPGTYTASLHIPDAVGGPIGKWDFEVALQQQSSSGQAAPSP